MANHPIKTLITMALLGGLASGCAVMKDSEPEVAAEAAPKCWAHKVERRNRISHYLAICIKGDETILRTYHPNPARQSTTCRVPGTILKHTDKVLDADYQAGTCEDGTPFNPVSMRCHFYGENRLSCLNQFEKRYGFIPLDDNR